MNKLQQEIIEIIQDYMDKTLSEGCIFKNYFPKQVDKEKFFKFISSKSWYEQYWWEWGGHRESYIIQNLDYTKNNKDFRFLRR